MHPRPSPGDFIFVPLLFRPSWRNRLCEHTALPSLMTPTVVSSTASLAGAV
jgi:hypothetical protein